MVLRKKRAEKVAKMRSKGLETSHIDCPLFQQGSKKPNTHAHHFP